MTDHENPDYRYQKYSEDDPFPTTLTNHRGFILAKHADGWPMPGGAYVVRMLSDVSGKLSQMHPGNPYLYKDLVPELARLSRTLPPKVVEGEVFEFLQQITDAAGQLVERLKPFEPPKRAKPGKRPAKKRSRQVDALRDIVAAEHAAEMKAVV